MGLVITELLLKAWKWLKAHWPQVCAVLAVVLALTTIKGCVDTAKAKTETENVRKELLACQSKPPEQVIVKQDCKGEVKVIYREGPCPDVIANFSSVNDVTHTAQAPAAIVKDVVPTIDFWFGGGYLNTPYASVGVSYKAFGVEATRSVDAWGGSARVKTLFY